MKLVWHSPTDPSASDVAHYSYRVLPWLMQSTEILNFRDFSAVLGTPQWQKTGPNGENAASRFEAAEIGQGPLHVYNLGNNRMHAEDYFHSLEEPGVVILHDLCLIDFARYISQICGDQELWREMLYQQYGEEVLDVIKHADSSSQAYARLISEYPLFQHFIEGALGVVVHSDLVYHAVKKALPDLAVKRLNLPFMIPASPPTRNYSAPVLRFVFCGHVGPNRRLEQFIEAWGKIRDPARLQLDIFGNVTNDKPLLAYARDCGVADRIRIHGFVDDSVLNKAMAEAHFAVNLRWPTMGETSGSQLRYWSAALPTLVTDTGWYSELPDDTVIKVSRESEVEALCKLLSAIVASPTDYESVGMAGWQRLQAEHSPEVYAHQLADFFGQQIDRRLVLSALDRGFADDVASLCADPGEVMLFESSVKAAVAMLDSDNLDV